MPVLLRLAVRNLRQHRAKTLIIGILVAMGMTVLVSGSAVVATAAAGVRKTFIENFTGSVVVTGVADADISLFGVHANMMSETVPTLPRFADIREHVSALPGFGSASGQITGYAVINAGDEKKIFTMFFGIEPEEYRSMFPNVSLIEGSYLQRGEEGLLLEAGMALELREATGMPYRIGDPVLLSGFGAAGFRIREVPLRGIFVFDQRMELLERLGFVDSQSLRSLLGMTVATPGEMEVAEEEISLLALESPDAMFSGAMIAGEAEPETGLVLPRFGDARTPVTERRGEAPPVWHFLLAHFDEDADAAGIIAGLNRWFEDEGMAARAIDWKQASAGFGLIADAVRVIFIVAILVVAAVAVIVIMNTLTVSVLERTSEIGTMRALGARRSFVWKMLLTETLTITLVFGSVGIVFGVLVIIGLRSLGLEATDMITNTLFGGAVFRPALRPGSPAAALLVTALIGVISCLYPIHVAMRIPPVRAIGVE